MNFMTVAALAKSYKDSSDNSPTDEDDQKGSRSTLKG